MLTATTDRPRGYRGTHRHTAAAKVDRDQTAEILGGIGSVALAAAEPTELCPLVAPAAVADDPVSTWAVVQRAELVRALRRLRCSEIPRPSGRHEHRLLAEPTARLDTGALAALLADGDES